MNLHSIKSAFYSFSALALTAIYVGVGPRAEAQIVLGAANSFAILGGSGVTNTGPSNITGDVGISPGSAITLGGATVTGGIYPAIPPATTAHADAQTAYNQLAGLAVSLNGNLTGQDLGGKTLAPGVYNFSSSAQLTGTLTLAGSGLYVFQVASTFVTASGAVVNLTSGAEASNVFFQVASSATLGTNTAFAGTIISLASDSATTGTSVNGRLIALTGAVTLDTNAVVAPTGLSVSGSTLDLGLNRSQPVGNVILSNDGVILGTGTSSLVSTGNYQVQSGTVTAILAGSGSTLTKTTTGTATLSGANTFTGNTTVSAGTLLVDGSLMSPQVLVTAGGTLGGHGIIHGDYVNNGGVTSPGNSPGILTITGNYTENGTLKIEVGGTAGPGVNPTGHDQVVVGGTTTIQSGSVLQLVKFTAYEPARGDKFTIISGSAGSIHGKFGSITTTFTNDLVYLTDIGELVGTGLLSGANILTAFPGAAPSQQATITSLQVAPGQFGGGDLLAQLLANPGNTTQIFNLASPEAYAGFADYAARATQSETDFVLNTAPVVQSGRFSILAGYSYYNGGSDSSTSQADYRLNSYGGMAGVSAVVDSHTSVGVFVGDDHGSVRSTNLSSSIHGHVYGSFASYDPQADHRLIGTGSFTFGDFSASGTRTTAAGSSTFGPVRSNDYRVAAGVQYVALKEKDFSVTPEFSLAYGTTSVKGFTETNATTGEALQIRHQTNHSLIAELGVNGCYALSSEFDLTGRVGLSHDFNRTDRNVTASVVGSAASFNARAPGMGDTEYTAGLGLNYKITPTFHLRLAYEAGFAEDAKMSQAVSLGASFGF